MKVSLSTLFKSSSTLSVSVMSMSIQPAKLFISYWQVAAQIGPVLHFSFPPRLAELVKVFKPLVAAIHGFVALECAGLTEGFYTAWLIECFVIPAALWSCVGMYYLARRRKLPIKEANAKASDDALFVLFIVYPIISNKFFKMLNCRSLGTQKVLSSDYGISCSGTEYETHRMIAIVGIVVFSFGTPVAMMLKMLYSQHK